MSRHITKNDKNIIIKTFEEKFDGWGLYDIEFVNNAKNIGDCVFIDIEGDWKHAHGHADYLMEQLGYSCEYTKVTKDDGSDWYSATHGYIKI